MFSSYAENKNVPSLLILSARAIANGKNGQDWRNLTKEIENKTESSHEKYILISITDVDKALFEKAFNRTPEDLQLERPSGDKLYWLCEDKEKNRFICFSKEGYVHYKSPYQFPGSFLAMEIYQACVERENKIKIINQWCKAQNNKINYIFTDHEIDVAKTVEAFYTNEISILVADLSEDQSLDADKLAERVIRAMKCAPLGGALQEYDLEAARDLFESAASFDEFEFSESKVINILILSMQHRLLGHFKAVLEYMDGLPYNMLCKEADYTADLVNAMTPFMARYICDHQMDWLAIEDNSLRELADSLGSEDVYVQTYLVLLAILKKDELLADFLDQLFLSLSSNTKNAINFIQNNFLQAIRFAWNANNSHAVNKIFDFVRALIANNSSLAENCYKAGAEIKMRDILSDASVIRPEKIGALIFFLAEIADKLPEVQERWQHFKNAIFWWCVGCVQNKEDFAAMGKMLCMSEAGWAKMLECDKVWMFINSEESAERLFDGLKQASMLEEKKVQYLKSIVSCLALVNKEFMVMRAIDLLSEKDLGAAMRESNYLLFTWGMGAGSVELVMSLWQKLPDQDKKEILDKFNKLGFETKMYNFNVKFPEDKQALSVSRRF